MATAPITGSLPRARVSSSSASVLCPAVPLVELDHDGDLRSVEPFSRMLSWRLAQYWLFSWPALRRLSAMKATASAFCSTTRRVALWMTCPEP
jgi:hypothetical protein